MISENKKITLAITIVLIFTLSMLIVYEKIADPSHVNDRKREHNLLLNDHMTSKDLFQNDFSETNTVFLIGSSHLGSANVTSINQLVLSKTKNLENPITVYNLAAFGDYPTKRLESIKDIISTSPKVIFYQISYRDFQFTYKENEDIIPINFKELLFSKIYSIFKNHIPVNPQELLFSILRPIQGSVSPILEESLSTNDKTPFYHYTKFKIKSQEELKSELSPVTEWDDSKIEDENFIALKKIIEELEKNNIKIVIFTSPLHEYYLETLSQKQKDDFSSLLNNLEEEYNLRIYNFEDRYHDLDVWGNISHISYYKNVTIYNEDIANMIIGET